VNPTARKSNSIGGATAMLLMQLCVWAMATPSEVSVMNEGAAAKTLAEVHQRETCNDYPATGVELSSSKRFGSQAS